jgi:hypothetical protein
MNEELYAQIEGDEKALVDAMASIVAEYGKFGSPTSNVYIDYQSPAENADNYPIGVKCGNCVFHVPEGDGIACTLIDAQIQENGLCRLSMIPPGLVNAREAYKQLALSVKEAGPNDLKTGDFVSWNSSGGRSQGQIQRIVRDGTINVPNSSFTIEGTEENPAALIVVWQRGSDGWAATDTKVGHRFSTLRKIASLKEAVLVEAERYKVPQGVQSAARRALKWISEGKAGDGFTSVGRRRAAQLAAGGSVSRDTVARMRSYFARHAVDKNAEGFSAGEKGYPSPGRVAWDAWGGDAGRTWVNGIKLD